MSGPSNRITPAMAWMDEGKRLFVMGGRDPETGKALSEPAVIDVQSGESSSLPEPPVDGTLVDVTAAIFDGKVLVAGLICASENPDSGTCDPGTPTVLGYDPVQEAWWDVPQPSSEAATESGRSTAYLHGISASGSVVLSFGSLPGSVYTSSDLKEGWTGAPAIPLALPPASLNGVPFAGSLLGICVAGDQVVALDAISSDQSYGTVGSQIDGVAAFRLDLSSPTREWDRGPSLNADLPGFPLLQCLESDVVVTAGAGLDSGVQVLDLDAGAWSEVNPPSSGSAPYVGRAALEGDKMVFIQGQPEQNALLLDTVQVRWSDFMGPAGFASKLLADPSGRTVVGFNESTEATVGLGEMFTFEVPQ